MKLRVAGMYAEIKCCRNCDVFDAVDVNIEIGFGYVFTPKTQQRAQLELVKSSCCFERFA